MPNLRGLVRRSVHVRITAWDRHGNDLAFEAKGLAACTYQHENDHLDGVLMIDRMGLLKKRIVTRKMQKRSASNDDA